MLFSVPERYRLFVDGRMLTVVTARERTFLNIDHLCGIVFRPIRAVIGGGHVCRVSNVQA